MNWLELTLLFLCLFNDIFFITSKVRMNNNTIYFKS